VPRLDHHELLINEEWTSTCGRVYSKDLGHGFWGYIAADPPRGWFWALRHELRHEGGVFFCGSKRSRLGARLAVSEALLSFRAMALRFLNSAEGDRAAAEQDILRRLEERPFHADHLRAVAMLIRLWGV
jgi:hypothetical protein